MAITPDQASALPTKQSLNVLRLENIIDYELKENRNFIRYRYVEIETFNPFDDIVIDEIKELYRQAGWYVSCRTDFKRRGILIYSFKELSCKSTSIEPWIDRRFVKHNFKNYYKFQLEHSI